VDNETSIKVGKSKKTLNILNRSWNNPINNGLNFTSNNVNEDPCEYMPSVATLLWPNVGVKPNTWKKLGLELSQP
jgi:hypothetical protein